MGRVKVRLWDSRESALHCHLKSVSLIQGDKSSYLVAVRENIKCLYRFMFLPIVLDPPPPMTPSNDPEERLSC